MRRLPASAVCATGRTDCALSHNRQGGRDIETKVDDNYQGAPNKLAVHIHIDEGPRTRVAEVQLIGNDKVKSSELPELTTQKGQPYSEQELASDRESILNFYFDHGFPNATLEITTKPSHSRIAKT